MNVPGVPLNSENISNGSKGCEILHEVILENYSIEKWLEKEIRI